MLLSIYSLVSNSGPPSFIFFYAKMSNFLHFYVVTTPPVLSKRVAYLMHVYYSIPESTFFSHCNQDASRMQFESHWTQSRKHLPLWRNRLARSAVNRKVGGSSPPRGANYLLNSCSGILCVIFSYPCFANTYINGSLV